MCSDSDRQCSKFRIGDQEPAEMPGKPAEVSGTGQEAKADRWPVSASMKMRGMMVPGQGLDQPGPGVRPKSSACIQPLKGSVVKVF